MGTSLGTSRIKRVVFLTNRFFHKLKSSSAILNSSKKCQSNWQNARRTNITRPKKNILAEEIEKKNPETIIIVNSSSTLLDR